MATAPLLSKSSGEAPPPGLARRSWHWLKNIFRLRIDKSTGRLVFVGLVFAALFAVIGGRLAMIALVRDASFGHAASREIAAARPDILDRNGEVMASDVKVVSVFADPRKVVDK